MYKPFIIRALFLYPFYDSMCFKQCFLDTVLFGEVIQSPLKRNNTLVLFSIRLWEKYNFDYNTEKQA